MMIALKQYMPLTYTILLGLSCIILPNAYATLTLENVDIALSDSNINVTSSITMESLSIDSDGITTRYTSSDESREYLFDRDSSSTKYNVRWDSISSEKIQFTVLDVVTDARGNVTGTELGDVELDDVSVAWTYTTKNIIDIAEADKVEYFFTSTPVITTPNAIVIYINPAQNATLGGVYALLCPTNSTLTGLFTNGTFVCTDMSAFFP